MPLYNSRMSLLHSLLLLLCLFPASVSPQQTFLPVSVPGRSPQSTIPSFPEQSAVSGCSLSLPSQLFPAVRSSCIGSSYGPLHRSRCCPVLAAWLYSSFSSTALSSSSTSSSSSDMPLLPDDSETCVDSLESSMARRGLVLPRPNSTCDFVYCYCGIRLLRRMSCPSAFSVDSNGHLEPRRQLQALQTDCSPKAKASANAGLSACSNCLATLYKLNKGKSGNSTAMSERTSKMRLKDCQLMGLTWLLSKNRSKYMHTVTSVLRVIMLSESHNGTTPRSCSLSSDGMPYAVDSSEISGAPYRVGSSPFIFFFLWCLVYISLGELLAVYSIS